VIPIDLAQTEQAEGRGRRDEKGTRKRGAIQIEIIGPAVKNRPMRFVIRAFENPIPKVGGARRKLTGLN
jgi:hypothetical protein